MSSCMQKDLAALAEIVAEHPEDMVDLQNAVLAHNFAYANQVAEKIGLTEEKLVARGGGKAGIAGGILLVLVLYALLSEGHESPPPAPTPPQPPPTPTERIPDGGTG